MAKDIAGWLTFCFLLWFCWAVGAPIVADAGRQPIPMHSICPYAVIKHGIGADLRTFTEVRDLCAS